MLSDESRRLVEVVRALGVPPVHEAGAEAARAGFRARQLANPPGPESVVVRDVVVGVAADRPPVPMRLHVPEAAHGVVLFLHGGGWVLGDLDGFEAFSRRLAVATGLAVLTVEYRLAPEHPFPAALDDARAALAWVRDHRSELPSGRLVVLGESAGGNLAAGLLRDEGAQDADIAAAVLVYPVADHAFDRGSYLDPANQLIVDAAAMRWFWDQYVPDAADRAHPDASPVRGRGFLPVPTLVVVAEHDVLHDEVVELAERMRADGVPVDVRHATGQMHGFFTNPLLEAGVAAVRDVADWLRGQRDPGPTVS